MHKHTTPSSYNPNKYNWKFKKCELRRKRGRWIIWCSADFKQLLPLLVFTEWMKLTTMENKSKVPYKYISRLVRRDLNYDEFRPWFHLGVGTKNEILLNSELLDKTWPQSYFLVPLSPGGTSTIPSRYKRLETSAHNAHNSRTLLPSRGKKNSKFLAPLSCFPMIPSNSRGTTRASYRGFLTFKVLWEIQIAVFSCFIPREWGP